MNSDQTYPPVTANCVRCVMVGDIVGRPGMQIAIAAADLFRERAHADFLVANGENAADGTGIRIREFERLIGAGYDVVTLGDHVYKKREIIVALKESSRLIRPLNFPVASAGNGATTVMTRSGIPVSVISLMGRVFMRPVDCPFEAIDELLSKRNDLAVVKLLDFHAEATSDKQSMGWHLDGRISAIFGTHTHVVTADEQILPTGTGYHTDVGMTGPFRSVLGRKIDAVLQATIGFEPVAFQVATQDVRISATCVDVDLQSGHCKSIFRIQWSQSETT